MNNRKNRIGALDLGDKWIGIAIADPLGFFARPYTTVEIQELIPFIKKLIEQEGISTLVIGLPKTLRNTESQQTAKIKTSADELKQLFPDINWVLWDERLTSKHAATLKKTKTKEDKKTLHAIAAAIILNSYLEFLQFQKTQE